MGWRHPDGSLQLGHNVAGWRIMQPLMGERFLYRKADRPEGPLGPVRAVKTHPVEESHIEYRPVPIFTQPAPIGRHQPGRPGHH